MSVVSRVFRIFSCLMDSFVVAGLSKINSPDSYCLKVYFLYGCHFFHSLPFQKDINIFFKLP